MKKLKLIILSIWTLLSTSIITFAEEEIEQASFEWDKIEDFVIYIKFHVMDFIGRFLLPTAGAIIVIMIIWGGFKYIQGDPENGKKILTAAIIGLVIIVLSFLIINLINSIVSGSFLT